MNKLWKKESDGEIYVDLFPTTSISWLEEMYGNNIELNKHQFHGMEVKPIKSDRVSTDFRNAGNKKFTEKCWRSAMEFYNQSLCFAENDSENVSLAYANRSACFFKIRKYNECLNDIELTRENNYPKRLMRKLDEREIECLVQLKKMDEIQVEYEPKLSFDPDVNFPCLANVLKIQVNKKFGRYIVATRDIAVGQTVLVEEPYVRVFNVNDRTWCFTCLKPMKNFIPCQKCINAMFCDENCMQSNDIHKIACGAVYNHIYEIKFVVQSILIAVNAFSVVEHLMEFVEKNVSTPMTDFPKTCSNAQTKYAMFLKLNSSPKEMNFEQICKLYLSYKCIMDIPTLNDRFNTIQKQRFLIHLIWQHNLISDNLFSTTLPDGLGRIQALANIQSLFNHSCAPNLHTDFHRNKRVCITIKPVKKGQQLFVSYTEHLLNNMMLTTERQLYLKENFEFGCKCDRCVPSIRLNDSVRMKQDPNFNFIYSKRQTIPSASREKLSVFEEKCCKFMEKYGHLPWTDEIHFITLTFIFCLQRYEVENTITIE